MSVRECTIDYLIETTCIYIVHSYVFNLLNFMCLFIIMSISVRLHELWCTVRDMRLCKCSIIIIDHSIKYICVELNIAILKTCFRVSLIITTDRQVKKH